MSKLFYPPAKEECVKSSDNRVAEHNYYEHYYQVRDHKDWIFYASMKEQDKLAEKNEFFFKRRFGFDSPLEQRKQLIEAKNKLDLTDKEIKNLKKSTLMTIEKEYKF